MAKQTSLKSFFQRPNATDEGEPSDEDEHVIPEAIDVRTAPPEKRPKCRAFRSEWSDKFPWLMCEVIDGNDKMFCSKRQDDATDSQEGRIILESLLSLNIVRAMTMLRRSI